MVKQGPSSVLTTTVALIGLQLASRLLSFSLNQFLLRSVSPSAFGLATIQLDTLIGTVLFLLREGIRGAVVRTRSPSGPSARRSRTFSLPTFLSPLALLIYLLYSHFSTPSPAPSLYGRTIALYALSTLLELTYEPLYLLTLEYWEDLTAKRVKVEGTAIMGKAVATLAVVKWVTEEDALVAFGVGQLAYSGVVFAGLFWITRGYTARTAPTTVKKVDQDEEKKRFDPALLSLSWALTKQSVVKQLLTEGDKLAVGKFGSGEDMGGYAVALNYGSLIARILFQPLEESSRLYFSSLALPAPSPSATSATIASPSSSSNHPGPSLDTLLSLAIYLRLLLFLHNHLLLIFVLLAPSFTTPLLTFLLGPVWAAAASPALRAYCLSLPFLGFNGLTEAFFQSLASPQWIARGSAWMVICAIGFASATGFFVGWLGLGARGLVAANCVNMALRIGFSTTFIRQFFREGLDAASEPAKSKERVKSHLALSAWTPNRSTLMAFALGGWIVRASESRWVAATAAAKGRGLRALVEHLGLGAVVGVVCLGIVYVTRQSEIRRLVTAVKDGQGEEDKAIEGKKEK
ncbi:hypothetical protein JCM11251_007709 [Rhodosporidiobolus azoricus]